MSDSQDPINSVDQVYSSSEGEKWRIDGREGVPNLVVVEGDISCLLDEVPLVLMPPIDIESLWPSGLKTFLLPSTDTKIALAFQGENSNSFVSMYWKRYTPEFVLELLEIEDEWWKFSEYSGYARDRSKHLLDSSIEPSFSVESCFLEWTERYSVDYFGLELNMDSGGYKFVINSNKKDELLNDLQKGSRQD